MWCDVMIEPNLEGIARRKLSLAVDNTVTRQMPLPTPWFERWVFLAALVVASIFGSFLAAWLSPF